MSLLLTITYRDADGEPHSRWPRKVETQAEIEASALPVMRAVRREGGCSVTLHVMDDLTARTVLVARVKGPQP
jgi:DNA-binding IclR family transcriptional regulator